MSKRKTPEKVGGGKKPRLERDSVGFSPHAEGPSTSMGNKQDNYSRSEEEGSEEETSSSNEQEASAGSQDSSSDEDSDEEDISIITPTLLTQLQTILSDYPDDAQILRELVQNAEDAGAKCMKMFHDDRKFDPGGGSTLKQYFKSPGICVYNDAMFTEQDWKGIRTIYNSDKAADPLKVGRFGLGFKSVFHMTDTPVIISGKKLLVIDPLKSEKKETECKNISFKKLKKSHFPRETLKCIMNRFGFDYKTLESGKYKGTLFWFPLRQGGSSLSTNVYSKEKAEVLFRSFIKESSHNLLFLKNVERIEIFKKEQNIPYFKIEMCGKEKMEFKNARTNFRDQLAKLGKELPPSNITTTFESVIKTSKIEEHFVVVSCLTGLDELSEKMKTLTKNDKLHYSPYTGVALCTKTDQDKKSHGHVFCFLPLPLTSTSMTGLPVHINGFFDLEKNRRHLKSDGTSTDEMNEMDISQLWNEGIISELLPVSYHLLIRHLKDKCQKAGNPPELISDVYESIPDPKTVQSNWKPLIKTLYKIILDDSIFFTEQKDGKWLRFSEALFANFDTQRCSQTHDLVKMFLFDCGENLVQLPCHMIEMLKWTEQLPKGISPKLIRQKLKTSKCWQSEYSCEDKHKLLTFALDDGDYLDLVGIKLLPLRSGQFTTFSRTAQNKIFVVAEETAKLFPGLEERFVSNEKVPEIIWKRLQKVAKDGLFQLCCLGNGDLAEMFQLTFNKNCTKNDNGQFVPNNPEILGVSWIHSVWKEINSRDYDDLTCFEEVPLIPTWDSNKRSNKEKPKYFRLKGKYILNKYEEHKALPTAIQKVVNILGGHVWCLEQTIDNDHVIGKYIKLPTAENVCKLLKDAALSQKMKSFAERINVKCSDQERIEICRFLIDHCSSIPPQAFTLLKQLNIFQQTDNINLSEMVSLSKNSTMIGNFNFPQGILYPRPFLVRTSQQLLRCLGGQEIEHKDCLMEVLNLVLRNDPKYSKKTAKTTFMVHLQDLSTDVLNHVIQKAVEVRFMPSCDGCIYRVKDLFDSSSDNLKNLFQDEKGKFPDQSFVKQYRLKRSFLQRLGIRDDSSVSTDLLVQVANTLHNTQDNTQHARSSEKCLQKVKGLIYFLNKIDITEEALNQIKMLKWVPVEMTKPDDYPKKLPWFVGQQLVSPSDAKSLQFKNLIGSVTPLVSVERFHEKMVKHYRWKVLPDQDKVLEHFKNVIDAYNPNQNSEYISMTKSIFEYINNHRQKGKLSASIIKKLCDMKCILTNNKGFQSIKEVVKEIGNSQINFSLEPFIFEIASDLQCYGEIFQDLGVKPVVDFEVLKCVLEGRSQHYENVSISSLDQQAKKDRELVVNILNAVIKMEIDKLKKLDLLVPIKCPNDILKFKTVRDCTYTSGKVAFSTRFDVESDDEDDEETGNKVIYVHADINDLAPKLGVASVTQRFRNIENTGVLAWGQKEKLTTRISNLLDSYTDGFAVPKELVQNADDAGATKVCFLFDERENMDCRDGLFDEGLAECQGQAMWVYNDAMFQEKDFKNIIELGGKTKMSDTDKIGKFGLGFCSVYNLTDVPSFVSKDKLVILDPHLHHLGDFAIENNPGILLPLTKKYRKAFPKQFKPYNNIFGCDLSSSNKADYEGTLFRFPLRTQKQAIGSEIKKLQYTKREVTELLLKFVDGAANLLLFTQNVTEISIYHLGNSSVQPDRDMKLLFKAYKSNINDNEAMDNSCNILKEVTKAMKNEHFHGQTFPVQLYDIGYEVYKTAKALSKEFKHDKKECTWIISWGTGTRSFELAKKLGKKGAIPIGAVAVPVERNGDELTSFIRMENLSKGFYRESHIFCFLPLPVETHLPLHINGCFMISNDRRSLETFNKDDKSNIDSTWNDQMLSDIILSAYTHLLISVAKRSEDKLLELNYWTLWPNYSVSSQQDVSLLVKSFYQNVLLGDLPVFYRKDSQMPKAFVNSLSNCIVLDPAFRHKGQVGEIAYHCMLEFHLEDTIVIDMPCDIFENFRATNQNKIKERTLSKYDFFKKYFFPNIGKTYWHGMVDKRNKLLKEALGNCEMHDLVQQYECIPVKSNKLILRKPCDLVWKPSVVSDMFDVQDLRFPDESFLHFEEILKQMNMMVDTISSAVLLERAQSVRLLEKIDGQRRSKAIMTYLNIAFNEHLDVKGELGSIRFLPIMKKPNNWPLSWKTNENKDEVLSPSELFSPLDKNLVGSVGLVMDAMDDLISSGNIYKILSLKEVTFDDALKQLEIIGSENPQYTADLNEICKDLYKTINEYLKSREISEYQIGRLRDLRYQRVICLEIDKCIVQPSEVALSLKGNCSPYLYKMTSSLQENDALWELLEISKYFTTKKFIHILKEKKEDEIHTKLTSKDVKHLVNIIDNLCSSLEQTKYTLSTEERACICIPDSECYLRPLLEVCFDDKYPGIFLGNKDIHIIHSSMKQKTIDILGIMSKRRFHLSKFSSAIPFGQKEKLVTRLRNIISAYPRDHSVLNELLQNADDAGATEIHFVLDKRMHAKTRLFDEKWEPLQGPALCVFNDTCFSIDDLLGIQNLGEGSKYDDPTKTGQFGVGFNAVYHLTDVPSFLTRGSATPNGGTFCVLDPHCTYVPTAEPDTPGMQLQNLKELENGYKDVYNTYLQKELPAKTGTWFRFPLRDEIMAKASNISKESVDVESVEHMLQQLEENMKKSLLFLTNVKKITVSHIDSDQVVPRSFVELKISGANKTKQKSFISGIKQELKLLKNRDKQLNEIDYREVRYPVTIKTVDYPVTMPLQRFNSDETWLIVQGFGYTDSSRLPERLNSEYNKGQIGLLPRAGSAMSITDKPIEGKAFCFLPLPITTGLPVHINGHFALDQNRSHLFGGDFTEDIRYIWNKSLLEQVVAHTYASCLEFYIKHRDEPFEIYELYKFFSIFPIFEKVSENWWQLLTFETYKSVYRRELALFPICPEFMPHICTKHTLEKRNEHYGTRNRNNVKWIAMQTSEESFCALFDNLHTFYEDKRYTTGTYVTGTQIPLMQTNDHSCTFFKEQELRQILIDLGVKLVCTPRNIYDSINQACKQFFHHNEENDECTEQEQNCEHGICAKTVSPENILQFMKSWNTESKDKCTVNGSEVPLRQTVFKSIQRVICVLKFCFKKVALKIEDLENVPMLLRNNNMLTIFNLDNDIVLSKYCGLFPNSWEQFVHAEQVLILQRFNEHFKQLDIGTFMKMLPLSIDESIYRSEQKKEMEWDMKTHDIPNKKWMKQFWGCLNDFENVAHYLKEWCLFPCTWKNGSTKLISFDMAYTVIDLDSFTDNLRHVSSLHEPNLYDIFSKLELPYPSTITGKGRSNHVRELVATVQKPCKILKCLHFHSETLKFGKHEANKILSYLNDSASQFHDYKGHLRGLCLFTTITDQLVKLKNNLSLIVVRCDDMPVKDGLDELSEQTNTLLLRHNAYHENLYELLNCELYYPDEMSKHPLLKLYLTFILPNFHLLDRMYHLKHLDFVREKLLHFDETEPVLRNLRFIPCRENNRLKTANNFFSPHNTVCATICDPNELPPSPFCQKIWEDFMILSGMKSVITEDLFITFARQIQQLGKNEHSENQSKELITHLFSHEDLLRNRTFLQEVSKINFITPYTVPEDYSAICKQRSECRLISFQESVAYKHFKLAWTMSSVLPEYAVPSDQNLCEKLSIKSHPSFDCIVSHIHQVCHSLQSRRNQNETAIETTDLMTTFYKYLQDEADFSTNEQKQLEIRFSMTPIIHIVEHDKFLHADQVVLEILRTSEIPPYLLKGSSQYGPYFSLFKILGAKDEISIMHYVKILRLLKSEVEVDTLHVLTVDELKTVEKALLGIIRMLSETEDFEELDKSGESLYLLNKDKMLKPSHQLVLIDNYAMMHRLKNQNEMDVMFDLSKLKQTGTGLDIIPVLRKLPSRLQPQFLMDVVEEDLIDAVIVPHSLMADQLAGFLTGDRFQYIITRLSKTFQNKNRIQLSDENLQKILDNLKSLRVLAVERLVTTLKYNEKVVQGSEKTQDVFFIRNKNELYIKNDIQLTDHWMSMNQSKIARVITTICDNQVSRSDIQQCLALFNATSAELETYLDEYGAVSIDFKMEEIYPAPGTPVEISFLDYLVTDFLTFEAGDIVVYEKYDNTGDSEGQYITIYIYVKILMRLSDENVKFPLYLVDIGDGQEIKVKSYRLYRIIRPSRVTSSEIELHVDGNEGYRDTRLKEILQMVEEMLVDVYNEGVDVFKHVLRRLIRRWHPDKNQNSSFCKDVFQHFMEFAKKLQKKHIDPSKINKYRKHGASDWDEYKQGASTGQFSSPPFTFDVDGFADNIMGSYRRRCRHNQRTKIYVPDPQPYMARLWIQQAKDDIETALSALELAKDKSYNWVCVQSQQAAEKAIKAVQVHRDAKKVNQNHSLMVNSVIWENSQLKDMAQDLEKLMVNYSRMRYPRLQDYPDTPSDLYTKDTAQQMVELAGKIVELVDDTFFDK